MNILDLEILFPFFVILLTVFNIWVYFLQRKVNREIAEVREMLLDGCLEENKPTFRDGNLFNGP